jgi:hypothetical protein
MRAVWTRRLSLALGVVYAVALVAESVAHLDDGLAFWFGTLFVATTLVLVGTLRPTRNPFVSGGLVALGAAVGMLPTAWTLVVPLFAVVVVVLNVVDAGFKYDERAA